MVRGLSQGQRDRIRPRIELVRLALCFLGPQSHLINARDSEALLALEARRGNWDGMRVSARHLRSHIDELRKEAQAGRACAAANDLLLDIFVLDAICSVSVAIDEWDHEQFGNSLEAVGRALIHLAPVVSNAAWPVTRQWQVILEELKSAFPSPVGVSIEADVREWHCSICGTDILQCEHIPGRLYCGELCTKIAKDADMKGVALVTDPGFPEARVLRIDGRECAAEGLFWPEDLVNTL